jgi:hypothetical protein
MPKPTGGIEERALPMAGRKRMGIIAMKVLVTPGPPASMRVVAPITCGDLLG